jgi:hypothetical protein
VVVASIPLLGDIFDIASKANRRNYRLLQLHVREPSRHTWRDRAFLVILACCVGLVFALPIIALAWLVSWLTHR